MGILIKKENGISKIEVLIYVFVILLLVYTVFAYYQGELARQRDNQRIQDINIITEALAKYYSNRQKYPEVSEWECLEEDAIEEGVFLKEMKDYLAEIPKDPLFKIEKQSSLFCYHYKSADGGKEYKIYYQLEKKIKKEREISQVYSFGGKNIFIGLKKEVSWYDFNWKFRKKIKIEPLLQKISGELNNFPLLLSIKDENLKNQAKEDGQDIIFTDSSGKKLEREIANYVDGELLVWVKIPHFSPQIDSEIYIYYGNPKAAETNNSAAWDKDFLMVSHLDEKITTTTITITTIKGITVTTTITVRPTTTDSTINRLIGIPYNNVKQGMEGKVFNAYEFDGEDDYLNFGNSSLFSSLEGLTISVWVFPKEAGKIKIDGEEREINTEDGRGILGWEKDKYDAFQILTYKDYTLLTVNISGGTYELKSASPLKENEWNYLTAVYDGENLIFYLNGKENGKKKIAKGKIERGKGEFFELGRYYQESWYSDGEIIKTFSFKGLIDEIQISKIAKNPNWIETSYQNQKEPKSFIRNIEEEELY